MTARIAIHGFGRIGRCFFRLAQQQNVFEIGAIADVAEAPTLAYLLKYDSVHGRYPGSVEAEGDAIVVDGRRIPVVSGGTPGQRDWRTHDIWCVLEATGQFTRYDALAGHLEAGARKVVLSANPHPGDRERLPTFVMGVNHEQYDPARDHAVSNASCTTNCLAPVVQVLDEHFGIEHALVTTIHAYTKGQNLVDAPHEDLCRSRAAAMNMVPTSTGATAAVGVVLPRMRGRITGLSVRVPTPNVSLADVNLSFGKTTDAEEINYVLNQATLGSLRGIVEVTRDPVVSGDLNGCRASATVDLARTMVAGKKGSLAKVMLWYDNEMGYAARLIDMMHWMIQAEKEGNDGH
ncbi:MAG: type I glyceraldehyde-3-phosphate dehydrogenase [Candidatus Lernaella stagnicola]|nr:type I glyceraldehyde-3-phosphate dehydrogenase [Candidatus Lernaella stagnicola]